jgi:hypothetical protein
MNILDIFSELNSNPPTISKEDYTKAERDINERMRKFDIEQRTYFAMSMKSAQTAYITF